MILNPAIPSAFSKLSTHFSIHFSAMRVNLCNRGKAQRPISTLQTSHKQVTLLFCKRACSYSQAAPVRCWRLRLLRPTHQSNMITLRSGRPLWTLTLVRTNSFFFFFFAPSLTQKMFTWRNKKRGRKKNTQHVGWDREIWGWNTSNRLSNMSAVNPWEWWRV